MNGYKFLKCFRKEKRISGELLCPATGLIMIKDLPKAQILTGKCEITTTTLGMESKACPFHSTAEERLRSNYGTVGGLGRAMVLGSFQCWAFYYFGIW